MLCECGVLVSHLLSTAVEKAGASLHAQVFSWKLSEIPPTSRQLLGALQRWSCWCAPPTRCARADARHRCSLHQSGTRPALSRSRAKRTSRVEGQNRESKKTIRCIRWWSSIDHVKRWQCQPPHAPRATPHLDRDGVNIYYADRRALASHAEPVAPDADRMARTVCVTADRRSLRLLWWLVTQRRRWRSADSLHARLLSLLDHVGRAAAACAAGVSGDSVGYPRPLVLRLARQRRVVRQDQNDR